MSILRLSWLVLCTASLVGCAVGPRYQSPEVRAAAQWYAAVPHEGKSSELLDWWRGFDDASLLALQAAAEAKHPSLAQAVARIEAARAQAGVARASVLPTVSGAASQSRNNGSDGTGVIRQTRAGVLDASWELDVWGAVRAGRRAADAQVSAFELNWHVARTSLAAEVANTYVAYRACQAQSAVLLADVASREETARLTGLLVEAGFTAPAEGYLTQASAATGRQQQIGVAAECALGVKSMVALTGLSEPEVVALLDSDSTLPSAPALMLTALPVQVISQRPDVAAAERALAAASAQINVAQANRLPRLALLGNISFFGVKLSGASTQANSKTWSVGPSLSVPIFDAGQRAAQVDVAKAGYAQALAEYELAVAQAVKEVESALVGVGAAQKRLKDAQVAQNRFGRFFDASLARQKVGSASLLELEEARRNKLSADLNLIGLKREYSAQWIALYKAVGGGWGQPNQAKSMPTTAPALPAIPTSTHSTPVQAN